MSKVYTTDDLIDSVRLRGGLNDNDASGTGQKDDDIILFLNEEMNELVTLILEANENYLLVREKITPVANQSEYEINERAVFNKIKNVYYMSDSNDTRQIIQPISTSAYPSSLTTVETPCYYDIVGNKIVFVPSIGSGPTGWYEITWTFRPGELVKTAEARQITAVNTSTGIVTLDSTVPSSWTTNNKFDIHSNTSGGNIRLWSLNATSVSGNTITFSDAIDGSTYGTFAPQVGDWVCLEGQAVIPALPAEMHPTLAQAATVRVMESLQNPEGIQVHTARLNRMLQGNRLGLNPRTDLARKIVPNDSIWDYLRGGW